MRVFLCVGVLAGGLVASGEESKPFADYSKKTRAYLERVQQGEQRHAFTGDSGVAEWQTGARAALVRMTGLERIRRELSSFRPRVSEGTVVEVDGSYYRSLCEIETEPGISVPFYLLLPKAEDKNLRFPLFLCPHGHDRYGLHSYAGVYRDDAHREKILGREGNIAEQAVRRGFVALVPATRGLADEVLVPDPRGRHGNRPCRAQLMHCLVAGRTPVAERVWDMQCLLDWAESHPSVDKNRIVMSGNSGGGVLTAYTAAIDKRIGVAIPSCSFTSMTGSDGYIFHCDCCMVPGLRNWGDWPEIGGLVAPRHLLLVHGVEDGLHRKSDVEAAAALVKNIF
ncbi:MAG: acetylxylan esterase, partial [Roseibacillus sp.]|nr:acetylxylan esterase [Roseibacillus sp.]